MYREIHGNLGPGQPFDVNPEQTCAVSSRHQVEADFVVEQLAGRDIAMTVAQDMCGRDIFHQFFYFETGLEPE